MDVVLLVRGGGVADRPGRLRQRARSARAIAGLGVPVVTGIGHETDRSVADEVAHSAHKTPTAAAACGRRAGRRAPQAELDEAAGCPVHRRRGAGCCGRARRSRHASRTVSLACRGHLGPRSRIGRSRPPGTRPLPAAPLSLKRLDDRLECGRRPASRAWQHVPSSDASSSLDNLSALVAARDPARLLDRGWSITRADDGSIVTTAAAWPRARYSPTHHRRRWQDSPPWCDGQPRSEP